LPGTPALRREQIELQVALITPLLHVKGYAAPETKAAVEQARLPIDQAEALGEAPEDRLLLFSVLFGSWLATLNAFDGEARASSRRNSCRSRRSKGQPSRLLSGIASWAFPWRGRETLPKAERTTIRASCFTILPYIASWRRDLGKTQGVNPMSSVDGAVVAWLSRRRARRRKASAQGSARHRPSSHFDVCPFFTSLTQIFCGNYATATKEHDEIIALADEKGSLYWKALCTPMQGYLFALTGKASHAVQRITSGIAALRSAGTAFWMPLHSSYLGRAYAELGQFDDAWRSIGEAIDTIENTKETWFEAEANRIAGEIALQAGRAINF
jgi:hypothetical protein